MYTEVKPFKAKRKRILVPINEEPVKLNWIKVDDKEIYYVESNFTSETEHPLMSLRYRDDTWIIKVLGVRESSRRGDVTQVDKMKKVAETMLWSMSRKLLDLLK
jgi:hypothetical protein